MYSERLLSCAAVPVVFVAVLVTGLSFAGPRVFPSSRSHFRLGGGRSGWMGAAMTLEQALRLTNRHMIAFDLVLGSGAILAPATTLRILGHEQPSPDAEHLFRRYGPIWLTFAAAHAIAELR